MIELTEKQRQELQQSKEPVHVLDPAISTEYILMRADLHARLQVLLEQAQDEAVQEGWADAVEEARYDMANEDAP